MSVLFIWLDDYNIDRGVVDKEHQHLFELANVILSIENPAEQAELVKKSVKDLFDYMVVHFENEENLMREIGYPKFEQHAVKHKQIVQDMNDVILKCKHLEELTEILKRCMFEWVVKHIMDEDKDIGVYSQNLAITATTK